MFRIQLPEPLDPDVPAAAGATAVLTAVTAVELRPARTTTLRPRETSSRLKAVSDDPGVPPGGAGAACLLPAGSPPDPPAVPLPTSGLPVVAELTRVDDVVT